MRAPPSPRALALTNTACSELSKTHCEQDDLWGKRPLSPAEARKAVPSRPHLFG
jgi:hypothetical protein